MKIALALSGGGFRATVFHLGVLARLAKSGLLEEVEFVSSVSGGSLCTGLLFALNGMRWPSSQEYLGQVQPAARRLLTTADLQRDIIGRVLRSPFRIFETRADDLSALMQERWGIKASLGDLPPRPRWLINATCYETGKNWRFERFRMGDYLFGYSYDTGDVPVTDAMAASAGFPGLIGPLVFDPSGRKWFRYKERPAGSQELAEPEEQIARKTEPVQPAYAPVHLWDGGVYDNHGLEGLVDFNKGWRHNIEFLLVSDGAGRAKAELYRPGVSALTRIVTGIMMDQVRSLRARQILERIINHEDPGSFLQMGNSCRYTLRAAGRAQEIDQLCPQCMSDDEAELAANMPTVIRRLADYEYERLFRHGFEVADYTLYAYHPEEFNFLGYGSLT